MASVFLATVGYGLSFPFFTILLEYKQYSSMAIGLNASMPALGWIIASLLLPKLHARYGTRSLILMFLVVSLLGLIGFSISGSFVVWLGCRLLFGGGLGMFFRTIEYYLNSIVSSSQRGRVLGLYFTTFLVGIVIGSLLQPLFSISSLSPYIFILVCLICSACCLSRANVDNSRALEASSQLYFSFNLIKKLYATVPIAFIGIFVYGLTESVPLFSMPIYALKLGMDQATAAYTVTALVLGSIIFAYPLGMSSDKVGRYPLLLGCTLGSMLCFLLIPKFFIQPPLFFFLLLTAGGCLGGIYFLSLSIMGDKYDSSSLVYANAVFGIVYAAGSLIGPILHGTAMQLYVPHGMIFSVLLVLMLFMAFTSYILSRSKV